MPTFCFWFVPRRWAKRFGLSPLCAKRGALAPNLKVFVSVEPAFGRRPGSTRPDIW